LTTQANAIIGTFLMYGAVVIPVILGSNEKDMICKFSIT
jgi:hypothetical protein